MNGGGPVKAGQWSRSVIINDVSCLLNVARDCTDICLEREKCHPLRDVIAGRRKDKLV